MTVQRYKKNRQNAIVVPNHVPPCPESRAFLPPFLSLPLPSNLTAINLMAIKLNVKFVNIIWHVLLFHLRGDVPPTASRCTARCVPTYRQLRPDVPPTASRRTSRCVATQFGGHRQPVDERGTSSPKSDKVTRHSSLFVFSCFSKKWLESLKKKR